MNWIGIELKLQLNECELNMILPQFKTPGYEGRAELAFTHNPVVPMCCTGAHIYKIVIVVKIVYSIHSWLTLYSLHSYLQLPTLLEKGRLVTASTLRYTLHPTLHSIPHTFTHFLWHPLHSLPLTLSTPLSPYIPDWVLKRKGMHSCHTKVGLGTRLACILTFT